MGESLNAAYNKVKKFHKVFGHPAPDKLDWGDQRLQDLRVELIREEYQEFKDALIAKDPVALADAVGDLIVVILGSAVAFGIPQVVPGFDEICKSNMSKLNLDGTVKRREDGKVLKGDGYFKANITQFFPSLPQSV